MTRIPSCAVSLFALTATACAAHQQPAAAPATPSSGRNAAPAAAAEARAGQAETTRKKGTIYKDAVDQLIDALRKHARDTGGGVLGGTDPLLCAQILCAMGHCHRRYHVSDGPVVRPSLLFLLQSRQPDGSYGTGSADAVAATTAWVAEAQAVLDPDGYRDEIATARAWLAKKAKTGAAPPPPWQAEVDAVLAEVRSDRFPEQLAADAAKVAGSAFADPGTLDVGAATAALVRLVACQAANRQLDRPQGAQAAAAFSPAQQKAHEWLTAQQEAGVFFFQMGDKKIPDPAFTGFGMLALQTKPKDLRSKSEQETIDKGGQWLLGKQNEDGTWGEQTPNYVTCVVVGALRKWTDDAPANTQATAAALAKAQKAILRFQNAESGGYQRSDRDYGSIGYGGSQRGDLSNLHFSLQALRETGLPANDEAFQKAIVFLQRTQNLKSVNDFSGKVPNPDQDGEILDATSGDDGGAAYYPGNSAAGYIVTPDGKSIPRSYGSMTYALLKSYTLAGIPGDDPRVKAAVGWIQNNWTVAENPGADPALGEKVKYQGLYYYYMVLAQALAAAGVDTVNVPGEGGKATAIDWRKALREKLESLQQKDGTWRNDKNDRWWEGMSFLCTCYALTALSHCR
jgi:squalene-hopene/tetraprenyl-beta-curcumene cyclase